MLRCSVAQLWRPPGKWALPWLARWERPHRKDAAVGYLFHQALPHSSSVQPSCGGGGMRHFDLVRQMQSHNHSAMLLPRGPPCSLPCSVPTHVCKLFLNKRTWVHIENTSHSFQIFSILPASSNSKITARCGAKLGGCRPDLTCDPDTVAATTLSPRSHPVCMQTCAERPRQQGSAATQAQSAMPEPLAS